MLRAPGRGQPGAEARPGTARQYQVPRGNTSESLLDSYTVERRPHVEQMIKAAIALGQVVCMTDPEAPAARDEQFGSGQAPPPFPWLETRILHGGASTETIGHLGVQDRVLREQNVGLADDILGGGWGPV